MATPSRAAASYAKIKAARNPAPQRQTAADQSALASMNAVRAAQGLAPQAAVGPAQYAPGTRPTVVTQSGSAVYGDGRLLNDFAAREGGAQMARDQAAFYTQNGKSIMGDNGGQTYRQTQGREPIMNNQRDLRPSLNTSMPPGTTVIPNQAQTFTAPAASGALVPTGTPTAAGTSTPGGVNGTDYSALLGLLGRYNDESTGSFEDQYMSARDRELARQQEAINAVNGRYAQLISREREQGEVQQSRARAVSNMGGGLYSPRTEAQYNDINAFTGDAVRGLESQRGAEISNIYGQASSAAMQMAQQNQAAAQANRQGYSNTLLSLYERMQQDKAMAQQQALAEAGMLGTYNGAPTMDYLNYQRGVNNDQFDQSMDLRNFGLDEQQLELQRNQMEQQGYQFTQLDDGTYGYFNANTQEFVRQGSAARPMSSSSSGPGSKDYQFKELNNGDYGYFDPTTGQFVSSGNAGPEAPSWATNVVAPAGKTYIPKSGLGR